MGLLLGAGVGFIVGAGLGLLTGWAAMGVVAVSVPAGGVPLTTAAAAELTTWTASELLTAEALLLGPPAIGYEFYTAQDAYDCAAAAFDAVVFFTAFRKLVCSKGVGFSVDAPTAAEAIANEQLTAYVKQLQGLETRP
jgi:hypothetical protein